MSLADRIRNPELQSKIMSADAAAALIASNGELRLVHVEPVEISRSGWRRVRAELKKLAKTQTARLVADSDMM